MRRPLLYGLVLGLFAFTGCRASVSVDAKAQASARAQGEEEDESESDATPRETLAEPSSAEVAMLGARHDLSLKGTGATRCACLGVTVGQPSDPAFQWAGAPPATDPTEQQVLALTTTGIPCAQAPAGSLGASYWGYERQGEDVIVTVETASLGRPITLGAIIPKPQGKGATWMRARGPSPYGRGTGAGGLCRLTAPAP